MNTRKTLKAKPAPSNPLAPASFSVRRPAVLDDRARQAVVLCRDASPSMAGQKAEEAAEAVRGLLDSLHQPFNKDAFDAAVVDFHGKAAVCHALARAGAILPSLAEIRTGGDGTNMAGALALAESILSGPMPTAEARYLRPVVILFSDGLHNSGGDPRPIAERLRSSADVVTVAFGADADETLLTELATSPRHFYRCTDGAQLRSFLADVADTMSTTRAKGVDATRALGSLKQP